MALGKLILGIICLIGFVVITLYLIKKIKNKEELSIGDMIPIKTFSPIFIILLAFGATWSEIFFCFTIIAFIGVLISNQVTIYSAIIWIFIYALFSLVPTLAIYIASKYIKGERFQTIMKKICSFMTYFCYLCIPVILAIGAWWGIKEGLVLFR